MLHISAHCSARWDLVRRSSRFHQLLKAAILDDAKRLLALRDPLHNLGTVDYSVNRQQEQKRKGLPCLGFRVLTMWVADFSFAGSVENRHNWSISHLSCFQCCPCSWYILCFSWSSYNLITPTMDCVISKSFRRWFVLGVQVPSNLSGMFSFALTILGRAGEDMRTTTVYIGNGHLWTEKGINWRSPFLLKAH